MLHFPCVHVLFLFIKLTITAKCGQKTLFDGLLFYRRKRQNSVDPIDGERFFTVS